MSNHLFPILSDKCMNYFKEKLLNLLNNKCWLGYVDDTFILIENLFDTNHIFQVSNSIDAHI